MSKITVKWCAVDSARSPYVRKPWAILNLKSHRLSDEYNNNHTHEIKGTIVETEYELILGRQTIKI